MVCTQDVAYCDIFRYSSRRTWVSDVFFVTCGAYEVLVVVVVGISENPRGDSSLRPLGLFGLHDPSCVFTRSRSALNL